MKIVKANGNNFVGDEDIALVNLALSSLFVQCDISLNQHTINTRVWSNYPYKPYFDVLLDSTRYKAECILQSELFYKDSAGAMDGTGLAGSNIGHYERLTHTKNSNTVVLEGPIRMDICQQEWLMVNGVKLKIKFSQTDSSVIGVSTAIRLIKMMY